jgi:hypothetical protein
MRQIIAVLRGKNITPRTGISSGQYECKKALQGPEKKFWPQDLIFPPRTVKI